MCAKKVNKRLSVLLAIVLVFTMYIPQGNTQVVKAASSVSASFNMEGFAKAQNVTGGGVMDSSSSNYIQVSTAEELLAALNRKDPSTNKVWDGPRVIEVMNDIDLGYNVLSSTAKSYNVAAAATPKTHPTLKETGVSKVYIQERSNLTIFSKNGATIKHACFTIKGASNNIIIRNLAFDEIWEYDDSGAYDSNDWDYFTIEGQSYNIWFDHCTMYKAYDGLLDIKKASYDITVSWCKMLPYDQSNSFFMTMMNELENNQGSYSNYKKDRQSVTFDDMCTYLGAQKKCHLIGHSDSDSTMSQLSATLANNYYLGQMDRLPRLRGGKVHEYNCVMDGSMIWNLKNSLKDRGITVPSSMTLVSNGAISACNGSILLENCDITNINIPLRNNNTDPDDSSKTGKVAALNSRYTINNISRTWSDYSSVTPQTYTGTYTYTGNSTDADTYLCAWPCAPLAFDTDSFKEDLGYSYNLYKPDTLTSLLQTYAGAGAVSMSAEDWMSTSYSGALLSGTATQPSAAPTTSVPATPSTQPSVAPTTSAAVTPSASTTPVTGSFEVTGSGTSWGTAFGYNMNITNKMAEAIDSWKIIIEVPDVNITGIWCANYEKTGNTIIFTPDTWNGNLAAGASTSFGFNANGTVFDLDSYKVIYTINGTEYTYVSGTGAPVVSSSAPVVSSSAPVVSPSASAAAELNVSTDMTAGTYTSDLTVNGFTFITGGSKWVVDSSNKTCNGVTYTQRAKSGGKGTTEKRAISFTAASAGSFIVHAMSGSSTEERRLTLNLNGTDLQSETTVGGEVKELVFTLPSAGTYVLYPSDDNVGIFYMKVTSGVVVASPSPSATASTAPSISPSPSATASTAPSVSPSPSTQPSVTPVDGDIFVAPNANGTGTQNDPMSFTDALTAVQAGNTIYCLAGTYSYDHQITIAYGNNGSEGKYKSIVAYNGADVVFDFSAEAYGDTATNARGIQLEGDYWRVYGIKITGAADNGMMLSGKYNLIENCEFDGNRDTGLQVSRRNSSLSNMADWPAYNTIKNCTSCNNMDPATGENADGFAAKLTCGEGNVFDGCISYNNVDDGWDCYAKSATGPIGVITIKNCIAFRNGQTVDGTFTENSDGNGFKLGGSGIGTPHIITNCIAFENKNHGFTDNNNPTALQVSNCTSFNNSRDNGGKANFQMNRAGSGAVYKNLLSYSTNTIAGDKFIGTISNSVYYNSSKYYLVTSEATVSNNKVGTAITGPSSSDFESISSPALGADIHELWRNADGSVNTGSFLKVKASSSFYGMGAAF